jgi:hypothetical protein
MTGGTAGGTGREAGLAAESVRDAGAFLARLIRLDPAILVRLRPVADEAGDEAGAGGITLWAWLPFDVLAARLVSGRVPADLTVRARDLLDALPAGPLPVRRDTEWRGALPPAAHVSAVEFPVVESVPAAVLRQVSDAAARTLRDAAGRGTGERRLRDAILDHVAITLSSDGNDPPVAVPTRIVTGLARMGFLGDEPVRFRASRDWLCAQATFGAVWYRRSAGLALHPVRPEF